MRTFQVEQAIFASSDRGTMKGYQLVARSPGVDRSISQSLCRWAPTQVPSDTTEDWMINYFPINDDCVAVTRTVLGGPEYSNRGGKQVVTLILVLRNEHFHAYSCNPILVAKTALALGLLRLPLDMDHDQLPVATMPIQPLIGPSAARSNRSDSFDSENEIAEEILETVTNLICDTRRIALIGIHDPIATVERLICKLPLETRRSFSFTTGLAPTVRRPFQAHFLADVDQVRQRTLDAQNIKRIEIKD